MTQNSDKLAKALEEAKKYNMREAFADSKLGMNAWLSYETLLELAAISQPQPERVTAEQLMDRIDRSHYNYLCMVEEIRRKFPNGVIVEE